MGVPPTLSVFLYTSLFIFSGIELKLCLPKNIEILIICKDMDVVLVDMQPCMDALVDSRTSYLSNVIFFHFVHFVQSDIILYFVAVR